MNSFEHIYSDKYKLSLLKGVPDPKYTTLSLVETENNQRGYKLETTTIPNPQQPFGHEEMSEELKIKVGNRIEPVILETP